MNCPHCQAELAASDGHVAVCADCGIRTDDVRVEREEAIGTAAPAETVGSERDRASTVFDISDTSVPEMPSSSPVGPIVIIVLGLILALMGAYFAPR